MEPTACHKYRDLRVHLGRKETQVCSSVEQCTPDGGGQCVLRVLPYAGRAAGSRYNVKGGTSDTLCMPEKPQYLSTDTTATFADQLNSVEYETFGTSSTPFRNVKEHNMPCAVCHTDTKNVVLMIPAQHSCPTGWNNEFHGYLMTEYKHADRQRRDTICVDVNAEATPGSASNTMPVFIYLLRAGCGVTGLPCPPYNDRMVLPCVMCTK